jgi:two-component system phosphate regulon sensor histidine kinase PhoR
VNWKPFVKLALVCHALAALSAIGAVVGFIHASSLPSGPWLLVFMGGALVAIGAQLQSQGRSSDFAFGRLESERKLLEAQLNQQRRSIDALADGLEVAIFLCDLRGLVLYANRRAVEMFKFENPLGRSILAVTLSYDLEQLVLDAVRLAGPRNAELTFSYPDERVGVAKAWIPDEEGHRVFVSVFEITPLRRLERIRQDFVSNVSHELRTPLTVIRAMAETLLEEKPPSPEQLDRYLPRIIAEVDRLATISNDLLLLSAAESNPVRKSRCDIAEVFRTIVQELLGKAHAKGLELVLETPGHVLIEANSAQMSQVAINLIDNAINYTSTGEIRITISRDDESVLIQIADTGIGIASEHVPRIFERFYRVDRARSRSTGGTGLGLSIVKHIVEAHGGGVSVQSALNRGSTFTVRMPIGDPTLNPGQD